MTPFNMHPPFKVRGYEFFIFAIITILFTKYLYFSRQGKTFIFFPNIYYKSKVNGKGNYSKKVIKAGKGVVAFSWQYIL
jgi:hypothetical protein